MKCGKCKKVLRKTRLECNKCHKLFHIICSNTIKTISICEKCITCYKCNTAKKKLINCKDCNRYFHLECNNNYNDKCLLCLEKFYINMEWNEMYKREYGCLVSTREFTPTTIFYRKYKEACSEMRIYNKKNIEKIIIGGKETKPLYFSPYFFPSPVIYICDTCLFQTNNEFGIKRHQIKCEKSKTPGTCIYNDPSSSISVYEIDGAYEKEYCVQLCLLGKCFLDNKTLFYDIEPFMFFVVKHGKNIAGYFSKEKSSVNYNLSCIVIFPTYKKKGYGQFLIDLSYKITVSENRVGTPEKPLSAEGLKAYQSYWKKSVLKFLVESSKEGLSISEISKNTGMTVDDVVYTLELLEMLKENRNEFFIEFKENLETKNS